MKQLYLICNAHLDPVWQWEFEEGVGAVLSTFRAAADFCDEQEGFVFNHNEALIYEWVERYEPSLFERIKRHVKNGKWKIMGAWYLQPDCNMPCGESFVRQIEAGKRFFSDKFNQTSSVAVNFDPFGHTKGLVQILEKSGYIGYICCRPYSHEMYTPARESIWKGFNNSQILVHRSDSYNHQMGKVDEKIKKYISEYHDKTKIGMVLWGVGNHGGGPSQQDLQKIEQLKKEYPNIEIMHSTPEEYFHKLYQYRDTLYTWDQDINPTMPGCYTSQVRIKQTHRRLENELYLTEKMCSHASITAGMEYPSNILNEAQKKLLFSEFHDILPGSSIQAVEEQGLEIMHHGLDLLRDIKAQAFYRLCSNQQKAEENTYPVLVYNPHPFEVERVLETEFMLADQNFDTEQFDFPQVCQNGNNIPSQPMKERSNVPIQWRKKVAFSAKLKPFSMNRFDIKMEKRNFPAEKAAISGKHKMTLKNGSVTVNTDSDLIDSYIVNGIEYVRPGFCSLCVYKDNEDPWGMVDNTYSQTPVGFFQLIKNKNTAAKTAAVPISSMEPVHIIEDGELVTNIEAIFEYENSYAVINYIADRVTSSLKVKIRLINSLKDKMIKLLLPIGFEATNCVGKTAFGQNELDKTGMESVSQEYLIVNNPKYAMSIIKTGCYGSHFKENTIGLSLLRGCAYCAHPIGNRQTLPVDRFVERVDQGERIFSFEINCSETAERYHFIEQEASINQQKPQIISFFPTGKGKADASMMVIDNPAISISALKKSLNSDDYILRLFNSSSQTEQTTLCSEPLKLNLRIEMNSFEIKTLKINYNKCIETELIDI